MAATLYALVLAVGRDALPGATERFHLPVRTEIRRPQRLGPVLADGDAEAMASIRAPDAALLPVQVRLLGTDVDLRGGRAGVASFHTETGGDFRWLPVRAAEVGPDGSCVFEVSAREGTQLTVTFAAAREHARHGYIDRELLVVRDAEAPEPQTVTLSAATHEVVFELPAGVDHAGPLRLQRASDRQWLPMQHATAGIKLRRGERTALELAAGTYELQAPLSSGAPQAFSVPAADRVTVSPALARSAAVRR